MYTEKLDQWHKMHKNFTDPLSEWNKATTEICQRMAQQNLEIIGNSISRFSEQLKRFTHVKKPEDFINIQKECMNEGIAANIECMQKIMTTTIENVGELTKLCGSTWESCHEACTKSHTKSDKND